MISLGRDCHFCPGVTVVAHCKDDHCKWSRCPKCASYGVADNWVQWHKDDYMNPYSLLDLEVAEPERKKLSWLENDYGTRRFEGERW